MLKQGVRQKALRGLLKPGSPQGKVRFGLPQHALRFMFPQLWPKADADAANARGQTGLQRNRNKR